MPKQTVPPLSADWGARRQRRLVLLVFVPALVLLSLGFGVVLPFFVVFDGAVAPPLHGVSGVVSGVTVTLGFARSDA